MSLIILFGGEESTNTLISSLPSFSFEAFFPIEPVEGPIDVGHFQTEDLLRGKGYIIFAPEEEEEPFNSLETQLPIINFRGFGFIPVGNLEAEFPGVSFVLYAGEHLDAELSFFSFEGDAVLGNVSNFDIEMPTFQLEMFGGSALQLFLPILNVVEMTEIYNRPISFSASMPVNTMLLESGSDNLGSLSSSLPVVYIALKDYSINSNFDGVLRIPHFFVFMLSGVVTDFEGSFSNFGLQIESIVTGDNDLIATLYIPQLNIQSGEIAYEVLRYIKRKIR